LHDAGKKVICYVSTGSWEEYRPDAGDFPADAIGKDYEGWPGEKWLDIRHYEKFADIMQARFDLAKSKGCDGIDADNMQNYQEENTGFEFNAERSIGLQHLAEPASSPARAVHRLEERSRASAGIACVLRLVVD
jgi:hypothetical protein